MLGKIIKSFRSAIYRYPQIKQDYENKSVHNSDTNSLLVNDQPLVQSLNNLYGENYIGIISDQFQNLKIALVTDYLTSVNLSYECRIRCLTPRNYKEILLNWKPDFIFVESAFHGFNWSWSYKLARASTLFEHDFLADFRNLISLAHDLNIKTVFWNKDDGYFFENFIEAASLCDFIYTADQDSIDRYYNYCNKNISVRLNSNSNSNNPKDLTNHDSFNYQNLQKFQNNLNDFNFANQNSTYNQHQLANLSNAEKSNDSTDQLTNQTSRDSSVSQNVIGIDNSFSENQLYSTEPNVKKIDLLPMAIQPRIHYYSDVQEHIAKMCFVGSYYTKILEKRREFLDLIFNSSEKLNLPIDIYDRNSNRFSKFFEFRFPQKNRISILPKVAYEETANIYRKYNLCLNVNSVTDSSTMCSRRLLEILACGGIVLTNNSKAVEQNFKNYCTVVTDDLDLSSLLPKMINEISPNDRERAIEGSRFVIQNCSWERRLEKICNDLSI